MKFEFKPPRLKVPRNHDLQTVQAMKYYDQYQRWRRKNHDPLLAREEFEAKKLQDQLKP